MNSGSFGTDENQGSISSDPSSPFSRGVKWSIINIISGIILLIIAGYVIWGKPLSPSIEKSTSSKQQLLEQPREGVVTINASDWRGVQCLEKGMRITGKILTPGVWWKARMDGNDSQIYRLYPKDFKTNSMLVLTNTFNRIEWMVEPGQSITQAVVAWNITKDTGWPPK